jgi:hypothetical protein
MSESQNVATSRRSGSAAERPISPSCHECEKGTSHIHEVDMPAKTVADNDVSSGTRRPKSTPRMRDDGSFVRPRGPTPFGLQWDARCGSWVPLKQGLSSQDTSRVERVPKRSWSDSQKVVAPMASSCDGRNFSVGEIVFIHEHGKPEHGIANVLSSYLNASGNRVYDVKYVVGRKEKGVHAQFITPHHF